MYIGFGGSIDVLLPELLPGSEGGRGKTPFEPEREEPNEETVDVERADPKDRTLPGAEASLFLTSEARLLVSLLEAGEPGFRCLKYISLVSK